MNGYVTIIVYLHKHKRSVLTNSGNLKMAICSFKFLPPANEVWGKVIISEACVILVMGWGWWSLYDVTSCLAAWSHVPSWGFCLWSHVPSMGSLFRGSLSGGLCLRVSVQGGFCRGDLCSKGDLCLGGGSLSGGCLSDPLFCEERQYASYWNAFLSFMLQVVKLLLIVYN